jgi:glycosyltransferase involved in cell wall biosynthesis
MTYRLLAKNKPAIIVDAHTAAFDPPWAYLRSLHKIILKKADAVIVTNAGLEHRLRTEYEVERCFVLPDKIPDLQSHLSGMRSRVPMVEDNSFRVAVICSFAPDEPVREILAAAKLRRNVTFYITGNFSAAMSSEEIAQITDELANVIFTGYLDKTDYVSLLSDVNAVIVLTKRQDTMLSGAYEALSLAKPLITSSHPALLQYFSSGTIHANNTPEDIARALDKVIEQENRLSKESFELRNKRQIEWWRQFNHVVGFLGLMPPTYIVQSEGKAAEGADSAKRTDTEAI